MVDGTFSIVLIEFFFPFLFSSFLVQFVYRVWPYSTHLQFQYRCLSFDNRSETATSRVVEYYRSDISVEFHSPPIWRGSKFAQTLDFDVSWTEAKRTIYTGVIVPRRATSLYRARHQPVSASVLENSFGGTVVNLHVLRRVRVRAQAHFVAQSGECLWNYSRIMYTLQLKCIWVFAHFSQIYLRPYNLFKISWTRNLRTYIYFIF